MKIYPDRLSILLMGFLFSFLLPLTSTLILVLFWHDGNLIDSTLPAWLSITLSIFNLGILVYAVYIFKTSLYYWQCRKKPLIETTDHIMTFFNPVDNTNQSIHFEQIKAILFDVSPKSYGFVNVLLQSGECVRYGLDKPKLEPARLAKALVKAVPDLQMAYGWDYRVLHRKGDSPVKYFQQLTGPPVD